MRFRDPTNPEYNIYGEEVYIKIESKNYKEHPSNFEIILKADEYIQSFTLFFRAVRFAERF